MVKNFFSDMAIAKTAERTVLDVFSKIAPQYSFKDVSEDRQYFYRGDILTTAKDGREIGIEYGANVVMPNLSPQQYRAGYQLYDNKQGTEATPDSNVALEGELLRTTGRTIGFNRFGSALHFRKRTDRPED